MNIQKRLQHLPWCHIMVLSLRLYGVRQETHCAGAIDIFVSVTVYFGLFPDLSVKYFCCIPEHTDHAAPVLDLVIQWIVWRYQKLKGSRISRLQV